MYKHILVPTDGSQLSLKAAKAAAKLASETGAKITTVYVIAPYSPPSGGESIVFRMAYDMNAYDKAMREVAGKALDKAASYAEGANVPAEKVVVSDRQPWQGIIQAAKARKCDLIAMASHGRRGLAGLLLGSETNKVLTHSKTPVLVWR
jgi:nucleotide-binding universal stress UspA family protein